MKVGPSTIADIILTEMPIDAPPEALEDVILRIIVGHPEWKCVPEDKVALWASKVKWYLATNWDHSIKQGKQPRISFNSVSDYKIQGSCFIEPCESVSVKEQKLRRLRWKDYYAFLRSLRPEVFEKVCARLLGLLGVTNPVLTPYRADQGIDFFGQMSMGDLSGHGALFPVFETDLIFWLVGQAKHYPDTKISTPDLRALAGSVFLGRARAFPREKALPQLNIRACDPVIMLFFTTGEISFDGWCLCRNAGIVAMDGEMLAAYLADKQVGIEATGAGDTQSFSPILFAEWLGIQSNAVR